MKPKPTSHITHRHSRRQKIEGLTPGSLIAQMTREANEKPKRVRKVPAKDSGGTVLPPLRPEVPGGDGGGGVFAALDGDDPERAGDDKPKAVSDGRGVAGAGKGQLSAHLKRLLGQAPPADLLNVSGVGRVGTNGELLAEIIMREALEGKQWAIELVRDQVEGKPVRAATIDNGDQAVEDHLDRVSAAALNSLAKGK